MSFNNKPAPVDDEIVELVRSQIGDDGLVKTFDELKAGDEVRINNGRFQIFCGAFERGIPDSDRVQDTSEHGEFSGAYRRGKSVSNEGLTRKGLTQKRLPSQHSFATAF